MLRSHRNLFSTKTIVLGSSSPRRKEILDQASLPDGFCVVPSLADENLSLSNYVDVPWKYAIDTANLKSQEVLKRLTSDPVRYDIADAKNLLVISADTVVVFNGTILGKPKDKEDAFRSLSLLNGKTHKVYTGVVLLLRKLDHANITEKEDFEKSFYEATSVTMDDFSDDVIKNYIATGEPHDKAGAYGIQAEGGTLVKHISGDFYNVMGFPLNRFCREVILFLENLE